MGQGSSLQCCMGVDDPNEDPSLEERLLNESKTKEAKTQSHYIALSETILEKCDYHYTLISTKLDNKSNDASIISTKNCKDKELLKCGDRVTDSSILTKDGELYVVIRRKIDDNDFNELQKYKLKNYKNININDVALQFEYIKTVEKVFEGHGTNIEGLELIYDGKNEKELGFLMVNDLFGKETHTNLYFMNKDDHTKMGSVYDFKDFGENQLSCINYFNGLNNDCYLFLPQTLGLNDQLFDHWIATLDEEPFLYGLNKSTILQNITKLNENKTDDSKTDENNLETKGLNKIFVKVTGFENETCLFKKYSKKNGYDLKGFEALAIDKNNNGVLTFEARDTDENNNDTFNFIVSCKFVLNNKNQLQLVINIDDYSVAKNNGNGLSNRGQEALFFVSSN